MILEYSFIIAPKLLEKWKVAITSVKQEYKSTERKQNYRTGLEIIYEEREASIDIEKAKDNYNKDGKPRYFNCNIYRHIMKNCRKLKKEKKNQKVL